MFALVALAGQPLAGCAGMWGPTKNTNDRPIEVKVITRARWPEGEPLRVSVNYLGPIYYNTNLTVTVKPLMPDARSARDWVPQALAMVSYSPAHTFGDRTQIVGTPPPGITRLDFRVKVEGDGIPLLSSKYSRRITVPVEVRGDINDVLTPVHSEEISRRLKEGLDIVAFTYARTGHTALENNWCLIVRKFPTDAPVLRDITFAERFEVWRDEARIATGSAWWQHRQRTQSPAGQWDDYNTIVLSGDMESLGHIEGDPARWTLRLLPDPVLALRNFNCDRYWADELTLPIVATTRKASKWDESRKRWIMEDRTLYDGRTRPEQPPPESATANPES
jgi:hypothetical protein